MLQLTLVKVETKMPIDTLQPNEFEQAQQFLDSIGDSRVIIRPVKDFSPWPLAEHGVKLDEQTEITLGALDPSVSEALTTKKPGLDSEAIDLLSNLAAKNLAFSEVEESKLAPFMTEAKDLFGADKSGVALRAEVVNQPVVFVPTTILDSFPALQRDDKSHRLLYKNRGEEDTSAVERAFELLALPSEVKTTENGVYAITELVEGAERPTDISREELSDWMDRISQAQVELGVDIGDDTELDNFIRFEGRLYWCDGNLMGVKGIEPDRVDAQLEQWHSSLEKFATA